MVFFAPVSEAFVVRQFCNKKSKLNEIKGGLQKKLDFLGDISPKICHTPSLPKY